jgi:hypothetical protein
LKEVGYVVSMVSLTGGGGGGAGGGVTG